MKNENVGMIKTLMDAHTMGVHAAASLLDECGYRVLVAPDEIEEAFEKINLDSSQQKIVNWIRANRIIKVGISYRLDPKMAVELVGRLVTLLKKEGLYEGSYAPVRSVFFAGLKEACDHIDVEYSGRIATFRGGETAEETLIKMGVPAEEIPEKIIQGCKYDKELSEFGRYIIDKTDYKSVRPFDRVPYREYGTMKDSLLLRLDNNFKVGFQPLIRAHSGPYSPDLTRQQCLKEYRVWCSELADKGFLDILSIGSSQLSQSNFGENWDNKLNGGGVPVNSEEEFADIWKASRPMLVRTYSATKNILKMAKMYETTINNAWNALSLWWFDELDGRGPNDLFNNLSEHIETICYAASTGKPVEANVPHHFAFRGCDDVTYIVSAYLSAKLAKKQGCRAFILQNMLNTPKSTWGIQDLAKSRAMLKLVRSLEDDSFRVILQTRAGLGYFKPDLDEARIQLAAATAMMDDIDPYNEKSPEIIHVVSFSEALFLATPDILNESVQITRMALGEYRKRKREGQTPDVNNDELAARTQQLLYEAGSIIEAMEKNIYDLYSAQGFYLAFVAGWLPVPELWSNSSEFSCAKNWCSKLINGSITLTEKDTIISVENRINKCVSNLPEARCVLKEKYGIITVRDS